MVDIEARLREGWRPAKSLPRTWQRGARVVRDGEDLVEDLGAPGVEVQSMTAEEEAALIEHVWASDVDLMFADVQTDPDEVARRAADLRALGEAHGG
jgi:hypothetical protein